jgi:hypothetical protein
MEKKNKKLDKELTLLIKKNNELRVMKDGNDISKESLKTELVLLTRDFDKWKKGVDDDKKDIE